MTQITGADQKQITKKTFGGGFTLMMLAVLFLWNPHINVIDILPDCLGWLFAALSMTQLAYAYDDIAAARRRAWILFGITLAKLAPMAFSLIGAKTFPMLAEPTLVLTYTVCFGALEMVLGMGVIRSWLETVSKAGLLFGSNAAVYGNANPRRKTRRRAEYAERLRRLTLWVFLIRFAASVIPELVYLRSTEYLGNVIYGVVIDIRDYRPYLVIFFTMIAGIYGMVWLVRMMKYCGRLRADTVYSAGLEAVARERRDQIACRAVLERFHIAIGMFFCGGVFLCHFSFENVNLLPDFAGIFLIAGALYLLRRYAALPRAYAAWSILGGIAAIPYYAVRTWHSVVHHGFWSDNLVDYIQRNVALSAEKQAYTMRLQLIMLALAVLETLLVIFLFRKSVSAVNSLNQLTFADGNTLYDSMTADMMRSEKEKYEKQPKMVFLWFCVSAGFEVLRALPVFAFVITPIASLRLIVNLIFLWKLFAYLESLAKIIGYHYRYNPESASVEAVHEQNHDLLH